MKKISHAVFALSSFFAIKGEEDLYNNIYTPEIYDQEEIRHRYSDTDWHHEDLEEVNHRLVEHFLRQKEEMITRRALLGLQKRLEILEEKQRQQEHIRHDQRAAVRAAAAPSKTKAIFKSIASFLSMKWGDGVDAAGAAIGIAAKQSVQQLEIAMKHLQDHQEDIASLQAEREKLLQGITQETWHSLEEAYIRKKRFLPEALCKSIEERFISARGAHSTFSIFYRNFFSEALALPTRSKPIGLPGGYLDLLERFERNAHFQGYAPETREMLKRIILTIAAQSHTQAKPYSQRGIYFWGAPGTGKTTAAKQIAAFLELPCHEVTILSPKDIAQTNLEGGPFWHPQMATPGLLAKALLAHRGDGKTCLNSILILNEFEKILEGGEQAPLNFLLDILDPQKASFYNPYFDVFINISRLTVILTGNAPIPVAATRPAPPPAPAPHSASIMQYLFSVMPSLGISLISAEHLHKYHHIWDPYLSGLGLPPKAIIMTLLAAHIYPLCVHMLGRGYKTTRAPKAALPALKPSRFEALQRRLDLVKFNEFPEEQKREIIRNNLERLADMYHIELSDDEMVTIIDESLRIGPLCEGFLLSKRRILDRLLQITPAE